MLVLSRKVGERVLIGKDIAVTVVRISGGGVRLGIQAPSDLAVIREELSGSSEPANPLGADAPRLAAPLGSKSERPQTQDSAANGEPARAGDNAPAPSAEL